MSVEVEVEAEVEVVELEVELFSTLGLAFTASAWVDFGFGGVEVEDLKVLLTEDGMPVKTELRGIGTTVAVD